MQSMLGARHWSLSHPTVALGFTAHQVRAEQHKVLRLDAARHVTDGLRRADVLRDRLHLSCAGSCVHRQDTHFAGLIKEMPSLAAILAA